MFHDIFFFFERKTTGTYPVVRSSLNINKENKKVQNYNVCNQLTTEERRGSFILQLCRRISFLKLTNQRLWCTYIRHHGTFRYHLDIEYDVPSGTRYHCTFRYVKVSDTFMHYGGSGCHIINYKCVR